MKTRKVGGHLLRHSVLINSIMEGIVDTRKQAQSI